MVIECPDCATRFAVDSHALAHIEEPTFHCSRCGNYFKQDEQPPRLDTIAPQDATQNLDFSNESPSRELSIPDEGQNKLSKKGQTDLNFDDTENDYARKNISARNLEDSAPLTDQINEGWSMGLDKRPFESSDPEQDLYAVKSQSQVKQLALLSEEEIKNPDPDSYTYRRRTSDIDLDSILEQSSGTASVSANWPSSSMVSGSSYSFSEPSAVEAGVSNSAAWESTPPEGVVVTHDDCDSGGSSIEWTTEGVQASVELDSNSSEAILPKTKREKGAGFFRKPECRFPIGASSKPKPPKATSTETRFTTGRVATGGGAGALSLGAKGKSSKLWVLLSFPLFCCAIFLVWGLNIDQTPPLLKSFFSLERGGLPSIPPAGLTLIGITPQIQSLDSGHKLLEISGNVLNSTNETYTSLKLEARAFTKANKETSRFVVPLDNALRDSEELGALTPELIDSMQKQVMRPGTVLSPNVLIPFRILVPALKGDEVWFSTRVYSSELH